MTAPGAAKSIIIIIIITTITTIIITSVIMVRAGAGACGHDTNNNNAAQPARHNCVRKGNANSLVCVKHNACANSATVQAHTLERLSSAVCRLQRDVHVKHARLAILQQRVVT